MEQFTREVKTTKDVVYDEKSSLVNKINNSFSSENIKLFFLCLSVFGVGTSYSLFAPFFPTKVSVLYNIGRDGKDGKGCRI